MQPLKCQDLVETRRQIAQYVSNRCKDLFKRKKIEVRCTLTINMQDSSIFFLFFFFESVPDEVLATCKSIQMQTELLTVFPFRMITTYCVIYLLCPNDSHCAALSCGAVCCAVQGDPKL